MTGPVGGAGELLALVEKEIGNVFREADGHPRCEIVCKYVRRILESALAAKAPQGVPADSALCPECRLTDNHPYVTYDGVAMRACGRCMIEWRDDTAPRLPVPGPVSDDTIHHGPFPPAHPAQMALEHDRTQVAEHVTAMKNTLQNYAWLLDGRGPYEWDDDRYRAEFQAVCTAMQKHIEVLARIAADWTNCPKDYKDILAARGEAAAPKPAPPSDEQVRKEFYDREYQAQEMATPAPHLDPWDEKHTIDSLSPREHEMQSRIEQLEKERATPAPGADRAQLHPNRKTVITHDQARAALQHFVNRHFNNPGEKSRASIPAHQDDDDILLFDYITQREALAAAPPAPKPIETLVHQLTKVTMELEDTLASLGKADSMITKLKDLIAERDRHASAERVRELIATWRADAVKYQGGLPAAKVYLMCADALERALPPSTGEKP